MIKQRIITFNIEDIYIMKTTILFLILFLPFASASAQIRYYVSPDGDDKNSGTLEQPLASLTGARDAIRLYKKQHTEPASFTVIISGGFYSMREPLVLTPEDGGLPGYPVTYRAARGEKPVFSGGKKISGFKVNDRGIWTTKINTDEFNGRFDQFYVDNKRAVLARTPNTGYLKISAVMQDIIEKGTGRIPAKAQQILTFDNENFKYLQNIKDGEIKHTRFRTYHKWDFTLRHIDSLDRENRKVFTTGRGMKPWNPIRKNGRIVFENYMAALDTAGEWYLDDKDILYYMPLPGQNPANTVIIAPVLDTLIYIKGDIRSGELAKYIRFEGLAFEHCGYRMPPGGFEPNQAAVSIDAAIILESAHDVDFTDCEIAHTGQHAIWIGKGCSNDTIRHCYLHDIGGGGIYLGDTRALSGAEHTHDIVLDNNIIHSGGREFPPAVGIWLGHSSDNMVTHNDIGDFYYTGISAGWVWGYKPSLAKRNIIRYNNIHHIGWDLLSDMAGIYTLGKSEGTIVSDNVIHHIHAYSYGGWGLYTDEGSSGILMENNLVYNTKTGGFHQHYGKGNIIRNNIFAYAKLYQLQCTRVEKHHSFDFSNNIIVFDTGVVLKGPWDKIDISMDYNLYWNTAGSSYDFAGYTFEKWRQTGHDAHSIIENPGFRDAPAFDFRFENDKSIRKIYFKPFDYSKAGVYGNRSWIRKAFLPDSIIKNFDKAVERNMGDAK